MKNHSNWERVFIQAEVEQFSLVYFQDARSLHSRVYQKSLHFFFMLQFWSVSIPLLIIANAKSPQSKIVPISSPETMQMGFMLMSFVASFVAQLMILENFQSHKAIEKPIGSSFWLVESPTTFWERACSLSLIPLNVMWSKTANSIYCQ